MLNMMTDYYLFVFTRVARQLNVPVMMNSSICVLIQRRKGLENRLTVGWTRLLLAPPISRVAPPTSRLVPPTHFFDTSISN